MTFRKACGSVVLPTLGLACFWAFLRYQNFLAVVFPPSTGALPTFLASLAIVSACTLARWRDVRERIERHPSRALCLALVGTVGSAWLLAANAGVLPGSLSAGVATLVAATAVSLGFLTTMLMWASHFAHSFGALDPFVISLSYLLSLLAFRGIWPDPNVAQLVMVALVPLGAGSFWWVARLLCPADVPVVTGGPGERSRLDGDAVTGRPAFGWALSAPVCLFVAFLLAGAVVRGIMDVLVSSGSLRYRISLPLTAALVIACLVFWLARRGRRGQVVVGPFALGCWTACSLLFFAGLFAFVALGWIDLGGSVTVVARSLLEISLWLLLCDLASRGRVAYVPLFVICCALVEALSWALSYLLVPALVAGRPGEVALTARLLAMVSLFGVACLVTLGGGMIVIMAGRRGASIERGDWVPKAPGHVRATPATASPTSDRTPRPAREDSDAQVAAALVARFALTPREADVAVRFARGYSLAKVSDALGITRGAAQTHIKSAYRKLGIHRKDELIEVVGRIPEGEADAGRHEA